MRLVASPHLSPEDAASIAEGYAGRQFVIEQRSRDALDELAQTNPEVYARLAWLVANGSLDIRMAIPRREPIVGIYHEKFGVFSDNSDAIAFSGSLNETYAAFQGNFEYIDVFTSWDDFDRVSEKISYFDRLWTGETARLDVIEFPEALKRRLIQEAPSEYVERQSKTSAEEVQVRKPTHHQLLAIDAWENNGRRGLLEMATGTGKTFTALTSARKLLEEGSVQTLVIMAPFIAIADQWRLEVADVLGIEPIVCHSMSGDWRSRLQTALALAKFRDEQLCIIVLYDTASGDEFSSRMSDLPGPTLLVADEVHNVNLDLADVVLRDAYEFRIGLSATPERYLDEQGTQRVTDYFSGIVFRFTLAEAIAADVLVPYEYHPIVCDPSDQHGYSQLSGVNAAKLKQFVKTFEATPAATAGYTLVYCQPQQLDEVKTWMGLVIKKEIHTFTAEENLEARREILREFGSGKLYALVAMRCLDEGVDVPPTRFAFLLGSSENPKQFVQRRGRVLRKYPGKKSASIYDFVYLPKPENVTTERELRKELTRFAEFALSSSNSEQSVNIIIKAAESRGIHLREYITQGV